MAELVPYLFFQGNAAEAMNFYKEIFGGELQTMGYDQMPGADAAANSGRLMHADLTSDALHILASDSPEDFQTSAFGNPELCLLDDDIDKMRDLFDALAVGGEVGEPLTKQFWGAWFGKLTDKFGVQWMFNVADGSE